MLLLIVDVLGDIFIVTLEGTLLVEKEGFDEMVEVATDSETSASPMLGCLVVDESGLCLSSFFDKCE